MKKNYTLTVFAGENAEINCTLNLFVLWFYRLNSNQELSKAEIFTQEQQCISNQHPKIHIYCQDVRAQINVDSTVKAPAMYSILHIFSRCPRSNFPGFKHIFWSVIVCVAMGCAAIFLYSNTIDFMNATVVTTVDTMTVPLSEVFFPSVVVCNINQVAVSKCCQR